MTTEEAVEMDVYLLQRAIIALEGWNSSAYSKDSIERLQEVRDSLEILLDKLE